MAAGARRRPGLTRVDLVVLVFFVVIGVGLLIPFLASQRARSSQAECSHHLRRIGDAMRQYSKEGAVPPSVIKPGYATWAVLIAPHLASESALHRWDLLRPYAEQADDVRQATLPVLFCPARPRESWLSTDIPAGGLGDYAAASGDGADGPPNGAMVPAVTTDNAFQPAITFDIIKEARGLAYTILAGDKYVPADHLGDADFGDGSIYNGQHSASFRRFGGIGFPLAKSRDEPMRQNFGSDHIRLSQFLYADGGVHPLATSIDERILGDLMRLRPPSKGDPR